MKTIPHYSPGFVRLGACIIAVLGLGLSAASALSPIVSLLLGGQDFGPGNTVDAKSKALLSVSTVYKYNVEGTCSGTGGLSKIKSGTPISAVFTNLKLFGTYSNPQSKVAFDIFDKNISGTQTIQGVKVTISARVAAGKLPSGQVYFKVTNVSIQSASPIPAGTIRFDPGAKIVVKAVPVVQFKSSSKNISESTSPFNVEITKFGKDKAEVTLNTVNGTADGGDFTPIVSQVVQFPAGTSTQVVPITILPNTVKDGFRRFTVTLSNPTNGSVLGTKKVLTVGITDDD